MAEVPTGYRFVPSDQELLSHYLYNKVMGKPLSCQKSVVERDLYGNQDPWEMCRDYTSNTGNFYFFTKLKMFDNGNKKHRRVGQGTWKESISSKEILDPSKMVLGFKKMYNYKNGGSQNVGGGWIMYEYSLGGSFLEQAKAKIPNWHHNQIVLCMLKDNGCLEGKKDEHQIPPPKSSSASRKRKAKDNHTNLSAQEIQICHATVDQDHQISPPILASASPKRRKAKNNHTNLSTQEIQICDATVEIQICNATVDQDQVWSWIETSEKQQHDMVISDGVSISEYQSQQNHCVVANNHEDLSSPLSSLIHASDNLPIWERQTHSTIDINKSSVETSKQQDMGVSDGVSISEYQWQQNRVVSINSEELSLIHASDDLPVWEHQTHSTNDINEPWVETSEQQDMGVSDGVYISEYQWQQNHVSINSEELSLIHASDDLPVWEHQTHATNDINESWVETSEQLDMGVSDGVSISEYRWQQNHAVSTNSEELSVIHASNDLLVWEYQTHVTDDFNNSPFSLFEDSPPAISNACVNAQQPINSLIQVDSYLEPQMGGTNPQHHSMYSFLDSILA